MHSWVLGGYYLKWLDHNLTMFFNLIFLRIAQTPHIPSSILNEKTQFCGKMYGHLLTSWNSSFPGATFIHTVFIVTAMKHISGMWLADVKLARMHRNLLQLQQLHDCSWIVKTPTPHAWNHFLTWFTLISEITNLGSELAKISQLAAQSHPWYLHLVYDLMGQF